LLLDPDNGDIRIAEFGAASCARPVRAGVAHRAAGPIRREEQAALLQSTAGLAALELGSPDTMAALVERFAADRTSSAEANIPAAGSLTTANEIPRALQLIDQAGEAGQAVGLADGDGADDAGAGAQPGR